MRYLRLYESFGEQLGIKEINILKGYGVSFLDIISKYDGEYFIGDLKCEYLKEIPELYEKHIINTCKKYGIRYYTILYDLTVDVYETVDLFNKSLTKLPFKFNNHSYFRQSSR